MWLLRRTKKQKHSSGSFTEVADAAEHLVEEIAHDAERFVEPVSKRYPTFFLMLATFGFVATLYGFERVIEDMSFLGDRPFVILLTGIATLVLTGTLYRKLK